MSFGIEARRALGSRIDYSRSEPSQEELERLKELRDRKANCFHFYAKRVMRGEPHWHCPSCDQSVTPDEVVEAHMNFFIREGITP